MNTENLNPEQAKAVNTINGPVLIIAGAGSGKTRVITFRIAHMLESGIPQSQILALTFTNKAAREMQERIKDLTGKKLQNLTISTFHALGVKILREYIDRLGWRQNFSIYDEVDRNQLIRESAKELKMAVENLDVYGIGTLFSQIKTGQKNFTAQTAVYRPLYNEYQAGLKLFNAVDFDDLIMLPIKLFREHPDVLAHYKSRFRYVMVDEFQDTSIQQYQMMHLIAEDNVCVVGDDDQSIYSWRGANYENIRMFERDFPHLIEIKLEQNYRSTGTILAAANGVISHNTNRKEKALWSGNGSGKPIEIFVPENESAEADFIADMIMEEKVRDNRKFSDFGVLIRTNGLARFLEEAFLDANIPYRMSGGTSFFQRKEIKDIISYLRVIANPDDDINLLRIINTPRRGIGKKTIEVLSAIATEKNCSIRTAMHDLVEHPPEDFREKSLADVEEFMELISSERKTLLSGKGLAAKVRKLVERIQYLDYLTQEFQKNEKAARFKFLNIEHLLQSIDTWETNPDNFDPSLYTYLNRITLLSRDDQTEEDKGEVNIMTIHAAKGLEFPVVFIAGAEDGIIPHARSIEDSEEADSSGSGGIGAVSGDRSASGVPSSGSDGSSNGGASGGGIEEERRLFYVAITRARDKLFITTCRTRRKQAGLFECSPSPFLEEIPAELVQYHEPDKEAEEQEISKMFEQMKKKFSM